MALNLRELEVFKPYDNEFPEFLLEGCAAGEEIADQWRDIEILRIAKQGEDILGVYAMQREDAEWFLLHGVVVAHPVRKQGLGRWLTGHAIGVAESKGARYVRLPQVGGSRCFTHIGFVRDSHGYRFDMIQE